jgi:hypothetical protein
MAFRDLDDAATVHAPVLVPVVVRPRPAGDGAAAPAPAPAPAWKSYLLPGLNALVLATVVVVFGYDRFFRKPPAPPAPPDPAAAFVALGSGFAPALAGSLADGFEAGADALRGGKTVAESDRTLKDAFLASRQKAFSVQVAPRFAGVLADGEEPKTSAERTALESAWRAFARGLRGGGKTP